MRSVLDDRTARAVIRDEALRLFAEHGPDTVTIRQIAAAAGVSPALVVHHFGSKEGLRRAVDERVLAILDDLFAAIGDLDWAADPAAGPSRRPSAGVFAEAVVARLPEGSPVPAYLRRLLLSGDPAGAKLFAKWYRAGRRAIDSLAAAGLLADSADPEVRAAFLLVNDLALLLLRDHLGALLGVDPLSQPGMTRWTEEVMTLYRDGVFRRQAGPGD